MSVQICLDIMPGAWSELARTASACERAGLAALAIADSPLVARELYLACAASALATSRLRILTGVTNPMTRHPSVAASAALTLAELAPGRIAIGIATGDSALWGAGLRPAKVAELRAYVLALKALLRGERAEWQGRSFEGRWSADGERESVPVLVACSGPKTLKAGAAVADGLILAMGYAPEDIAETRRLIAEACHEAGRDPAELELWWYSEVTFARDTNAGMEASLGWFSQWLAMGTMKGKRIPEAYKPLLRKLHEDTFDLEASYRQANRGRILVERARALGIHDWLVSRSARLWGTADDVRQRFAELEAQGLENWFLYPHGGETDPVRVAERLALASGA